MKLSYAIAKCIIKVFIVRKLAFRAVEKGRALVEVSEHFISKIETDRTAQTHKHNPEAVRARMRAIQRKQKVVQVCYEESGLIGRSWRCP